MPEVLEMPVAGKDSTREGLVTAGDVSIRTSKKMLAYGRQMVVITLNNALPSNQCTIVL